MPLGRENEDMDSKPSPLHSVVVIHVVEGCTQMGRKGLFLLVAIESTNNGEMGDKLPIPSTIAGGRVCADVSVTGPESHKWATKTNEWSLYHHDMRRGCLKITLERHIEVVMEVWWWNTPSSLLSAWCSFNAKARIQKLSYIVAHSSVSPVWLQSPILQEKQYSCRTFKYKGSIRGVIWPKLARRKFDRGWWSDIVGAEAKYEKSRYRIKKITSTASIYGLIRVLHLSRTWMRSNSIWEVLQVVKKIAGCISSKWAQSSQ